MPEKVEDFKDRTSKRVVIDLNGQRYLLKRYTIAQEIAIKANFGGSLEKWQDGLNSLDGESLVKSLWIFIEDKETFPSWPSMADILSGDVDEKMNILEAISTCITASMPAVQKEIKKKSQEGRKKMLTLLQGLQTGPGSTTSSPKSTGGRKKKSKSARTTK